MDTLMLSLERISFWFHLDERITLKVKSKYSNFNR